MPAECGRLPPPRSQAPVRSHTGATQPRRCVCSSLTGAVLQPRRCVRSSHTGVLPSAQPLTEFALGPLPSHLQSSSRQAAWTAPGPFNVLTFSLLNYGRRALRSSGVTPWVPSSPAPVAVSYLSAEQRPPRQPRLRPPPRGARSSCLQPLLLAQPVPAGRGRPHSPHGPAHFPSRVLKTCVLNTELSTQARRRAPSPRCRTLSRGGGIAVTQRVVTGTQRGTPYQSGLGQ